MNRAKIQAFGGFLTAMVLPNMGAFIAWGLITALFIATGWFPNEAYASLVDPMLYYLLPLLLAISGGRRVAGDRGGLIAAITTVGLIIGGMDIPLAKFGLEGDGTTSVPMFLGAMIMGPVSGLIIKKFDEFMDGKMPGGMEMIINNFSIGIIGLILCLISFEVVGPVIVSATVVVMGVVNFFVNAGFTPLLALIIDPAKVLFLNNVLAQGVFVPLAALDAQNIGQSIFYMLESNPGPGFGLLLAYSLFGTGSTKESAKGASIIHFIGGIHEIYFPYVLMKPLMIVPMIAGTMTGIFYFDMMSLGLVGPASPGSIIAYLTMTPKGSHLMVIGGVLLSTVVTFSLAMLVLKASKPMSEEELEASKAKSKAMKEEGKNILDGKKEETTPSVATSSLPTDRPPYIVFACDAGLGSSALGANAFNKKCKKAEIDIKCTNFAIEKMPNDVDVAVVHQNFKERVALAFPDLRVVTIENYLNDPNINELMEELKALKNGGSAPTESKTEEKVSEVASSSLPSDRPPYIVFACDAGLGSSALGANAFNKKCKKAGLDIKCTNFAIEKMPNDVDVAVVHQNFKDRVALAFPSLRVVTIENYLNDPNIGDLMEELKTLQGKTDA
ncbi:MAG: PTS mannitol-specific transporter subunit IIBC [Eubacteriales bacterium]